jgi:hypothetical protein
MQLIGANEVKCQESLLALRTFINNLVICSWPHKTISLPCFLESSMWSFLSFTILAL